MKSLSVIQHTSAEYLGLMEDHFEGRRIRFTYIRPFTEGVAAPGSGRHRRWPGAARRRARGVRPGSAICRPWSRSRHRPHLPELEKPLIGIGLGAQILALAGVQCRSNAAALHARYRTALRDGALNGYLPDAYPVAVYGRDRAVPPAIRRSWRATAPAKTGALAGRRQRVRLFRPSRPQGREIEDLIMEVEEAPADPVPTRAISARRRALSKMRWCRS